MCSSKIYADKNIIITQRLWTKTGTARTAAPPDSYICSICSSQLSAFIMRKVTKTRLKFRCVGGMAGGSSLVPTVNRFPHLSVGRGRLAAYPSVCLSVTSDRRFMMSAPSMLRTLHAKYRRGHRWSLLFTTRHSSLAYFCLYPCSLRIWVKSSRSSGGISRGSVEQRLA